MRVSDYTARPELSVVVPAFREGAYLLETIPVILRYASSCSSTVELIVVDDGSPEETWDAIQLLSLRHPEVSGLQLSRNFGKDAAVAAGLKACRGDAAIVIDADLQHPPELIPEFVRLWRTEGFQVIDGVKTTRDAEPLLRRAASGLFNWFVSKLGQPSLTDSTDYKLISREVLDAWLELSEYRLFFRGTVAWLGFRRTSLNITVAAGTRSESTWTFLKLLQLSVNAVVSFSSAPLRFAHLTSAGFFVFALLLGTEALVLWAMGRAVDGFTTVIILVLVVGWLTFAVLAVMSEYLAAIYDEVKQRPRFAIRQTTRQNAEFGHSVAARVHRQAQ